MQNQHLTHKFFFLLKIHTCKYSTISLLRFVQWNQSKSISFLFISTLMFRVEGFFFVICLFGCWVLSNMFENIEILTFSFSLYVDRLSCDKRRPNACFMSVIEDYKDLYLMHTNKSKQIFSVSLSLSFFARLFSIMFYVVCS